MSRIRVLITCAIIMIAAVSCALYVPPTTNTIGAHMVAEAKLTAHFIAAAVEAGMTPDEINSVLQEIASQTVISEFWISDHEGRTEYGSEANLDFAFPTDPESGTQAAPFANLLLGRETVVIQDAQPRGLDGAVFRYVGVAGVDQVRIVQVGLSDSE